MALKESEDIFDLIQTLPKRSLPSNLPVEDQQAGDFDVNENVVQNQDEGDVSNNVVPNQEDVVDPQSIERRLQLEMRQEVESIAKGLLHILKDLDEPGKSKIADDYVKAIHENMKTCLNGLQIHLELN